MDALRRLAPGDDPEATANAICAEIVDHGEFPSAAIYGFGVEDRITALGARLHDGEAWLTCHRSRAADVIPGSARGVGTVGGRPHETR